MEDVLESDENLDAEKYRRKEYCLVRLLQWSVLTLKEYV